MEIHSFLLSYEANNVLHIMEICIRFNCTTNKNLKRSLVLNNAQPL